MRMLGQRNGALTSHWKDIGAIMEALRKFLWVGLGLGIYHQKSLEEKLLWLKNVFTRLCIFLVKLKLFLFLLLIWHCWYDSVVDTTIDGSDMWRSFE
ncbi:unnamed protein product [Blepharisma stoltei]|uniref:Uncharacterized protein n=1 Tax=Blepharisma stoltei TaxID=1481888 RepID=A0AAU9K446_9CILI|nr:unnamed protein product [Blepharisma stoltei]